VSSARLRLRARRLLLDVSPLRLDRDFRWLWSGQVVSGIGNQITRIVLPYQVYVLTGSTLAIAGLTLFQLVAILVFALGAGSLADAVDRRRVILVAQIGQAACSLTLVVLSLGGSPPLLAIFGVAFVAAALGVVDQPARSSSIPRLVPAPRLPAAIALGQLNFQIASVVGPAIGGVLIATVGIAGAYFVDVVSFTASITAALVIAPLPPLDTAVRPGLAAIREGLSFARGRRVILSTFVIDLNAMIFGMPQSLFPVLALDVFKVGPTGFGLLEAAPAIGALLGALLSGWVSRIRRIGWSVIVAVTVWGAAITLFGLATLSASTVAFVAAIVFLAIAGAADVLSAVFRSVIVQLGTPDELRGRISSLHLMVVTSGPRIGDIEAAALASVIGPELSALSGGILCLLGVTAVARLFPELARHETAGSTATVSVPGASSPTPDTPT
jgi:MFS family permease